jgi:hypothetical protein
LPSDTAIWPVEGLAVTRSGRPEPLTHISHQGKEQGCPAAGK